MRSGPASRATQPDMIKHTAARSILVFKDPFMSSSLLQSFANTHHAPAEFIDARLIPEGGRSAEA
jgi:hypothetical protein